MPVDRVSRAPGRLLQLALKPAVQRLRRAPRRLHVLVSGVQRSGTNLVMDILERSWETEVIHERDPRGFANYEMRPLPVIRELARRSPAPVFVIKALCEAERLPELLDALAPARALWVLRHYDAVARSMLRSFPNQAQVARWLAQGPDESWWPGRGVSDETRALLREVVHDGLTDASGAALLWWCRNRLYFERGLREDQRVRLVRYEELLADPGRWIGEAAAFLGLRPTSAMRALVRPRPARAKPCEGIEPAVRALCDALWRRFQEV